MATEALTYVARRVSRERVSPKQAPGHARGWRELLIAEDAEALWQRLFTFIRSATPDLQVDFDQLTQEVFISLLAAGRFNLYIEQELTDQQIESDLLSLLNQ